MFAHMLVFPIRVVGVRYPVLKKKGRLTGGSAHDGSVRVVYGSKMPRFQCTVTAAQNLAPNDVMSPRR